MSKKKKIIIILLIIFTVILIILGIINNYEPFHFTQKIFFGKQSNKIIYDEEFSDIDTIYVNVDNANINFINRDSNKIRVEIYSNRKNVSLKSYNKKVSVITENMHKCLFCTMNVINIYAPSSFKEYINISNKYGHVNLENFENASIAITNKFGHTTVGKANMLKIIEGRGNINVKSANEMSVRNSWGNIRIDDVNVIELHSKISNISINNINKKVFLETDFGNVVISKINIIKDSLVKNNCGDVTINEIKEDGGTLDVKVKVGKFIRNDE